MKSDLHQQLQNIGENYIFNKGYWLCGQEVPMPLGVCDVWGLNRSWEYKTMAIEVKISRSDFRSKSQKYKENQPEPLGNYQYILCPKGLIEPKDIHKEWGLLVWTGKRIVNKKPAPFIEMTDKQKLDVIIRFLDNGVNQNRPLLLNDIEKNKIILENYSDWLHKKGYIDSDYYAEDPRAIDRYFEDNNILITKKSK